MSGLDREQTIYDEGYWEGLRVAWFIMFEGVLANQEDFVDVLQRLANARDTARLDFERHKEDDDDEV